MQAIFEKQTVDESKQNIEFDHGAIINAPFTRTSDYSHLNCILHAAIMIEHSIGSRAKNYAYRALLF